MKYRIVEHDRNLKVNTKEKWKKTERGEIVWCRWLKGKSRNNYRWIDEKYPERVT